MTLYEVMEQIRNPVERKPTPEELVLIRMIEQLTNAVRNGVVGQGTGIEGGL